MEIHYHVQSCYIIPEAQTQKVRHLRGVRGAHLAYISTQLGKSSQIDRQSDRWTDGDNNCLHLRVVHLAYSSS